MSMLLGIAKILFKFKDSIDGNVRFIFQPGEEGNDPKQNIMGAQILTDEKDYLDGVEAIFGMHIWGSLPTGKIYYKPGPFMMNNSFIDVEVKGVGGHASSPHLTIDPVVAVCQIVNGYQSIISRAVNALDPAVITVSTIETDSNGAYNIIPERARFKANLRSYSEDNRDFIIDRMEKMAIDYADAVGATVTFKKAYGAPAVINDINLTNNAIDAIHKYMGNDITQVIDPIMGSEDFSCYLKKVPGFFFMVGCGNPEKNTDYAQHHPKFNVDDDALKIGISSMLSIVKEYFK